MSGATMEHSMLAAMRDMTEKMMQMQAQAVERQATIERQQRIIDQLQSKIQQTEAANGQLRTRLSQNDEEPESTTVQKRTQPQSAAAAMSRQHSGSQKRHKSGVNNSASSSKAEGSYVYGNRSSSNHNCSAVNSNPNRGRMSHAVKPSSDSSRDAIYEYEADASNDSGGNNDEDASEANVCTTGSKQQHSYSCVKGNSGGNSRAVQPRERSNETAANYDESGSSGDDSDADSTNAMRHGNNKTAGTSTKARAVAKQREAYALGRALTERLQAPGGTHKSVTQRANCKLSSDAPNKYIPAVERGEPSSQTKAVFEDSYYDFLNRECPRSSSDCKCGSQLKALITDIRAPGAMQTAAQRERLCSQLHDLRAHWAKTSSHSRKSAVACRHTVMPREALPRLVSPCSNSADGFPYIAQQTASDVRAMRAVRSRANGTTVDSARWDVLQQRLQQYAASGAGTIAEAIVCNDCYWLGQLAQEKPSGGKAKAAQNRQKNNRRRKRQTATNTAR
eukprot:2428-Heterococcus_DN1.PRE.2